MEHSITIQAGEAFGSGAHPSTLMALALLRAIVGQHPCQKVLDIGCGSGLLSIAAAQLTGAQVLAADIQPESVRMTRGNALENNVGEQMEVVRSDGYGHPAITRRAPYDLILCNVLAEPVTRWTHQAATCLAPGGLLILSGMLRWQTAQVIEAHRLAGLDVISEMQEEDWCALALSHSEEHPS